MYDSAIWACTRNGCKAQVNKVLLLAARERDFMNKHAWTKIIRINPGSLPATSILFPISTKDEGSQVGKVCFETCRKRHPGPKCLKAEARELIIYCCCYSAKLNHKQNLIHDLTWWDCQPDSNTNNYMDRSTGLALIDPCSVQKLGISYKSVGCDRDDLETKVGLRSICWALFM